MKKILSLVLVLVLMMSVAVVAFATDGAGTEVAVPDEGIPSVGEMFQAFSDFLKLEAFTPYIDAFHSAFGQFYVQLDVWLRALGVVVNNYLGDLLNSGFFG